MPDTPGPTREILETTLSPPLSAAGVVVNAAPGATVIIYAQPPAPPPEPALRAS